MASSAGFGLGIGYISPVSTLIKWFPDRPGMATGMAIMGFGGARFHRLAALGVADGANSRPRRHIGVAETFVALGVIYFCFMMVGAWIVRVPAPGWKPEGWVAPAQPKKLVTTSNVYVYEALKTPQFWLIWWVLCLNVTAGIGVLGQASAMSQEMFPGHVTAVAAAGFVGLMSLFNMAGRFFWASTVGLHGPQEHLFLLLRARRRRSMPSCRTPARPAASRSSCCAYAIIFSMYGGGFATVPAYLRDMFGTRYVGAIHGMLITAWSMAGIFGPVLVNYIRQ